LLILAYSENSGDPSAGIKQSQTMESITVKLRKGLGTSQLIYLHFNYVPKKQHKLYSIELQYIKLINTNFCSSFKVFLKSQFLEQNQPTVFTSKFVPRILAA